jgi:chromosome segregation ATPase
LPQIGGGEATRDHQTPSQEPVAQVDDAETNAFDEWSDRAQGDYWGFQVRRKKNMLSKLRNVEGNMTKLSCRSAQLKESKERDTDQLRDLQEKIQALSERIREQATETEQVHQEENMASEAASDLRKQIRDVDEKLAQYWAEDD